MILADAAATQGAGKRLAACLRTGDVVALSGDLGVGKTTFARGVLHALGLSEDAPSPSFPIVIAYAVPDVRVPIWHVDLYRVSNADEIEELGLSEARRDAALLIEWPERMGGGLWPDALLVHFNRALPDRRRLTIHVPPAWEGRCPLT